MVKMWNSVFRLQAEKHYETCKIPRFELDTERKQAWDGVVPCGVLSAATGLHCTSSTEKRTQISPDQSQHL
ncbi:hypothetical protein KP79_PYT02558 [Mizuhopecten yessoensis]|uniref:Uncharacterized protein n=1 Tax=Mizuhopecten yessoensis TaxID=6573 RepID=A0A210PKD9_MIZYE|nr:hypothetical protein KP79_PYT02558 [Mizuhopecten yessoensis]